MAAATTPISSYMTYLMHKGSNGEYTKLVNVKSIPDLGGQPESIETTTLSDPATTSVNGIQTQDTLDFVANYISADYDKVKALAGSDESFAVYLGENGENGKFLFNGDVSVYINGVGVNEVVEMTISIAASTPVTKSTT